MTPVVLVRAILAPRVGPWSYRLKVLAPKRALPYLDRACHSPNACRPRAAANHPGHLETQNHR
jgi:hypothetical protein